MIRHINIKNFAIIEDVSVDFHDGLNIITGETGAGKSILIEAISLALGSRADTSFVRSGKEKALIQMIVNLNDKEYIISREISSNGKNICKINDEIVTLSRLNILCGHIADIHGQYDHQSLLNPENHISLLDLYHSDTISPEKDKVKILYDEYSSVRSSLNALISSYNENRKQKDYMEFQLQELNDAGLLSGEDDALENDIRIMQNSEKIYENLAASYCTASEDDNALISQLKHISDLLSEIASYSGELSEVNDRISDMYYEFGDICSVIRSLRDASTFSPQGLDEKISRLEHIKRLKDKHQKNLDELIDYQQELENSLLKIVNIDSEKADLENRLAQYEAQLAEASGLLTAARRKAAIELEEKICAQLNQLNFNDAAFNISFNENDSFSENGIDKVEFLITTNKGDKLKPLSKIASGGEMSRIMLAFKKIIGDYDGIPTMIFDEIDSGISGIAASVVGKKLLEISNSHQIICITHLPQIAACGKHSYRISKSSDEAMTYTTVAELSDDEKINEIARLLGGANITETTLKSARELIAISNTI